MAVARGIGPRAERDAHGDRAALLGERDRVLGVARPGLSGGDGPVGHRHVGAVDAVAHERAHERVAVRVERGRDRVPCPGRDVRDRADRERACRAEAEVAGDIALLGARGVGAGRQRRRLDRPGAARRPRGRERLHRRAARARTRVDAHRHRAAVAAQQARRAGEERRGVGGRGRQRVERHQRRRHVRTADDRDREVSARRCSRRCPPRRSARRVRCRCRLAARSRRRSTRRTRRASP